MPGVTQSATEEPASSSSRPNQQEAAEVKDEDKDAKPMDASAMIAEITKMEEVLAERMEEIEAAEAQDTAMPQKLDFAKL